MGKRLESLDAFRGFDMLFIMGFASVITALCALFPGGSDCFLARQMEHAAWDGFQFMDTVFPTFLFIAGISWPFSYAAQVGKGRSRAQIYLKIFKRAAILVLLGIIVNGLLGNLDFSNARYCSVLGRIGLAWMFSSIFYINFRPGVRVGIAGFILVGYYLLLRFVPVPGCQGMDPFSLEGNMVGYVDRCITPGTFYQGIFDPEGLLSTLPAIVTAMLGVFTGEYIRNSKSGGTHKTVQMLIAAAALTGAGLVWSIWFPINKALWSSSFVLVAAGYALGLYSLFFYIIDVRGWRKWAFPLKVIGMNSITIYIAKAFISFQFTTGAVLGGVMHLCGPKWSALIFAIGYTAICWLFLYFLYRKKVFLKV